MNYKEYSYCHVEGNTDIGCRRKANEDWYDSFVCDNGLVAVVCDGMGGHAGGQVASHLAIDTIRRLLTSTYFDSPKTAIVAACNAANQAILRRSSTQTELHGMGSTCAMIIIKGGKVYVGSVGDSRVYLVRNGSIRQLTKDQSYVQSLIDAGQITLEEAENHPRKNEIVNALGLPTMRPATVLSPITPDVDDSFLICSDGLTNMVDDAEIARVVNSKSRLTQGERVQLLINKARQNGGRDNITCQIIEFSSTVHKHEKRSLTDFSSLTAVLLAFLGVVLVGTGGYAAWKSFDPDVFKNESTTERDVADVPEKSDGKHVVDTVFHDTTGRYIFEIEENRQFQALAIYALNQHGDVDTLTVLRPLTLSSMKVSPAGSVNIEREGMRSYISFKEKNFKGETITLSFKDKDGKDYSYTYAVALNPEDFEPAPEEDTLDDESELLPADDDKPQKKVGDEGDGKKKRKSEADGDKDKKKKSKSESSDKDKKKRKSDSDSKDKKKKSKSDSDDSKKRKSEKSSSDSKKSKSSSESGQSGSGETTEKTEGSSESSTSSTSSSSLSESSGSSESSSSKSSSSSSSSKSKSSSSSSSSKSKSSSSSSSSKSKSSSSKSKSGSSSSSSKSKSSSSKSKSSSSKSKSSSSSTSSKSKSSSSKSSSSKSKSSSSKSSSSKSKSSSSKSSSSKSKSSSSKSSSSKK